MPKIIGQHKKFSLVEVHKRDNTVEEPAFDYNRETSSLIEILGYNATKTDDISVSLVSITPSDFIDGAQEEKISDSPASSMIVLQQWTELDHTEYYSILDFSAPIEIHTVRSNKVSTNDSATTNDTNNVGFDVVVVRMGETCIIEPGERYRLVFPLSMYGDNDMPISFIKVSKPASLPNLHIISSGIEDSSKATSVSNNVEIVPTTETSKETKETTPTPGTKEQISAKITIPDELDRDRSDSWEFVLEEEHIVYHMCPKDHWDMAVRDKVAYYPSTFEQDGNFIRVAKQPGHLVTIANRYYQQLPGDWICLKIITHILHERYGIQTKYEKCSTAMNNDDANGNDEELKGLFPRICGGIPTHGRSDIVLQIFPMERNDVTGEFLSIPGLGKYIKKYRYD